MRLALALMFVAVAIAAPSLIGSYQYASINPASWSVNMTILYDFNSTHAFVALMAPMTNPGWIGMLVNPPAGPSGMVGDAAVINWNGTAGSVCDCFIAQVGDRFLTRDTRQDTTLVQAAYADGVFVAEYIRPLSANGDTQDITITPNSGTYAFAAFNGGPSGSCSAVPQHSNGYYGPANSNFKFGGCPGTPACSANGICNAGSCDCDTMWTGPDCSVPAFCLTRADCSNAGTCVNKGSCSCDSGKCGDACQYNAGDAACNTGTFLSSTFLDSAYKLEWMIDTVASEITFKMTITVESNQGWIGFGIGTAMADADIYQGYFDQSTGRAVVKDCYSTDQAAPREDMEQNVKLVAGTLTGTTLTIQFTRSLDATGTQDKPITDSDMDCIISFNPQVSNTATKHTQRTPININFFSGTSTGSDTTSLRVWHGILMFLCWAVFTVIGMIMARFFKSIGRPWFITHIIANTVAIVIQWIGFILVIIAISNDNAAHFVRDSTTDGAYLYMIHAWVGLITIIIGTVQPFIGIAADRLFDPSRKSVPIWPDRIHWWLGRNAILFGLLNIYLGIFVADNSFGVDLWIKVVYGVWLLLVFIVYVTLQIRQIRNGGDGH